MFKACARLICLEDRHFIAIRNYIFLYIHMFSWLSESKSIKSNEGVTVKETKVNTIPGSTAGYNQLEQVTIVYNALTNSYSFSLNSGFSCSHVRISVGGSLVNNSPGNGLLLYSDVVNNYIGTLNGNFGLTRVGGTRYEYIDPVKTLNGMTFFNRNKFYLNGSYNLKITNFDGTSPTNITGVIVLLFEYFE